MAKVTIDQGTLKGNECTATSGYQYVEFLQIPYAKPPLNELRFKAPQPPEPWNGERDATVTSDTRICYQLDDLKGSLRGSEDCLYLNVYTPRLPSTGTERLPVMVYFHLGAYNFGNGTIKEEGGPDHLIRHDVVVVTVNYRLGIFGFLSLDIPEVAGNMGLKDQVMALKWIQKNISEFGGDKNNVTLFGCSAGSASVQFHIMSPQSKDLFHQGILQSGSALNRWAINDNIRSFGVRVSQALGYQGSPDDGESVYKFLIKQSTESIQDEYLKIAHMTVFKGLGFGITPCIEKDFGNGEAFLTEYPYDILKSGKLNKVKIIIGFCDSEGLVVKGFKPASLVEIGQHKFTSFWTYPLDPSDVDGYNEKFAKVYYDSTSDVQEKSAIDFFTDLDFASGSWISAELMADNGVEVYDYIFSYDGSFNIFKVMFNLTDNKGACHADDTGYILSYGLLKDVEHDERDIVMRDRLTKLWTDFTKTGNPTPSTNDLIPIKWPQFTTNSKQYLKIDEELEIKQDYVPKRIAVHRELYEKYRK